jgi:hypothetical protein
VCVFLNVRRPFCSKLGGLEGGGWSNKVRSLISSIYFFPVTSENRPFIDQLEIENV